MNFLKDLSTSQIWAQARQYITFVAGIATALGLVTVAQQPNLVDGVMTVLDAAQKVVAAIVAIAGGITVIVNALKSSKAASPESAVQRVQAIANSPQTQPEAAQSFEAKKALVDATNSIPEVQGVVTTPTAAGERLAKATPAPTVVPAGTPEAVAVAQGQVPL